MIADTAGMTRTATRVWGVFTTASTTGAMVAGAWDAVWGEGEGNAAPVLGRTGTGLFTFTLPQQVYDVFGNQPSVNLTHVEAFIQLTTFTIPIFYQVEPVLLSPYELGVIVWTPGLSTPYQLAVSDGPVTILIKGA